MADETILSIVLREGSGRESQTSNTCLNSKHKRGFETYDILINEFKLLVLRLTRESHGENWDALKNATKLPESYESNGIFLFN